MYRALLVFTLCFALWGSEACAKARHYYAAPQHFDASFEVMDQGLRNVRGFFREATGTFSFDAAKREITNLKLAIKVQDIETSSRDAGNDLIEMLKPSDYPEIVFMATAPSLFDNGTGKIEGTLTAHGESKPAIFEATLTRKVDEKKVLGLSLKGSFKRADFDMGDPPEIPGRFGEEITLMLEMKAVR